MEDLISVIEDFPSRLKKFNDGKGIPMKVRFSPETHIIRDEIQAFSAIFYCLILILGRQKPTIWPKNAFPAITWSKYSFHESLMEFLSITKSDILGESILGG